MRKNPTTTQELARMYFEDGLSPTAIGAKIGMTWGNVLKRLREAGYTTRKAGRGRWYDPRLAATHSPTVRDIAWAAGIYEGEGSCGIRCVPGKVNRSAIISVSQKEPWILERLRALFGGNVGKSQACTAGRTTPITVYHWRISGTRARGFMMTVFTFLSPHRQQKIRQALSLDINFRRLRLGLMAPEESRRANGYIFK